MAARILLLVTFAVIFVVSYAAMAPSIDMMKARGGKHIVDLAGARTAEDVLVIRRTWGPEGDAAARRSLWVDFPFILGYGGFLVTAAWSAAVVANDKGWSGWTRVAATLAIVFTVGALCDVAENVGTFAELRTLDIVLKQWPPFVSALSWVKWRLILGGVPVLVTTVVALVASD